MLQFSLTGTARHVFRIGDQWRQRAQKVASKFRTTKTSWCLAWPQLVRFPGPVQQLMGEELERAGKAIEDGEDVLDVKDKIVCPVDNGCLFYRQYQLPCRHIWHQNILFDCVKDEDWDRFAFGFEEGGFEIYETTNKEWVSEGVHDAIGGPSRHLLEVREVLDGIKDRYYELCENMADWTPEERSPILDRWLDQLSSLTGPIRQRGAQAAILELHKETAELPEGELVPRKRRRGHDDEEETEG